MKQQAPAIAIWVFTATAVFGQTPIVNEVANAASFKAGVSHGASFPGSPLARGSIVSIFGSSLGPQTPVSATQFPVTTKLGGSRVTIGGLLCPLLYVSASQINAIIPSTAPLGVVDVSVEYLQKSVNAVSITLVNSAPGIFTLSSTGSGSAAATNPLDANPASYLNTIFTPQAPGDILDLWLTGLGPIDTGDITAPPIRDMTSIPVEVTVGNQPAQVLFRGRSPCCAGVDQIRIRIPEGVSGCCVRVQLRAGGVLAKPVAISISGVNANCTALPTQPAMDYWLTHRDLRFGYVHLSRTFTDSPASPLAAGLTAYFARYGSSFYQMICQGLDDTEVVDAVTKELGPCTVNRTITHRTASAGSVTPTAAQGTSTELDAGPAITLGFGGAAISVPKSFASYTWLSSTPASVAGLTAAGPFSFAAPGGKDLAPFRLDVALPAPLIWTNKSQTTASRSTPLELTWIPATSDFFQISGSHNPVEPAPGSGQLLNVSFACRPPDTGDFSIPAAVMAELPVDNLGIARPLTITLYRESTTEFAIAGLDIAEATISDASYQTFALTP